MRFIYFLILLLLLSIIPVKGISINSTHDNNVEWDGIYHNSRDPFYRNPGWGTDLTGAVPLGQDLTLRIRSFKGDLTVAKVKMWDNVKRLNNYYIMSVGSSDDMYDYWEVTIPSPSIPTDFYYAFQVIDGSDIDYYNDDVLFSVVEDHRVYQTGGQGVVSSTYYSDGDYSVIYYDPSFKTPDWHKHGIGYQIFIDRFFNGNISNDPIGDGSSGDVSWYEWDSNGDGLQGSNDQPRVYVYKHSTWDENPTGGNDYFGGDFQGVLEKVQYLKDLGVDFIWFNPLSQSPDNHGYAVDDYRSVNAYYSVVSGRSGERVINNYSKSLAYFDYFASELEKNGIKIIYDTVINHASAQGKYFQRYESDSVTDNPLGFSVPDWYPNTLGAYESESSNYSSMFKFNQFNNNYDSWYGFQNIPTIYYSGDSPALEEIVTGDNNIFKFWTEHGVDGFRLDVNHQYQDGKNSAIVNQKIRESVKAANPDAVIIGEIWERASMWLTGTMNDGVQNMPFRFNTIDWFLGNYDDSQYSNLLYAVQENYPKEAFYSLWTNLGNHDRTRVLSALGGNTEKVLAAATLQFTYPGVPVVWYGDEVGTTGVGDPGTRATYPWGHENETMLDFYQTLSSIRKSYPVLTDGDFHILNDDSDGVVVFHRTLKNTTYDSAIIAVNRDPNPKLVTIEVPESSSIYYDLLAANSSYQVDNGKLTITLPGYGRAIFMRQGDAPSSETTVTTSITTTTASQVFSSDVSTTEQSPAQNMLLVLLLLPILRKVIAIRLKRKRMN